MNAQNMELREYDFMELNVPKFEFLPFNLRNYIILGQVTKNCQSYFYYPR